MKSFPKKIKWFIIGVIIFSVFVLIGAENDTDTVTEVPLENTTNKEFSKINGESRENRLIGLGITEGTVGFEKAFILAQSMGTDAVELPVFWNDTEPSKEKYVEGWMKIANQYFPKTGTKIAVSLNPIDTNNLRLPPDLKNKSFNDPEVISRYKSFVDYVASQLSDSDIPFVAIGNEVDVYLGNSDTKWQEYAEFFSAVAPYVRTKFPNAVVGSKITYDGIINHRDKVNLIIQESDVVLTTYYPFKPGSFKVRGPRTVHEDFKQIVDLYPQKQIYFAEIGYPSGEANDSSEEMQAAFIHEMFAAWDTYKGNILFLNYQWLHDASPETVADWQKYYGLKDSSFASFLGTLGLRTYEGEDKKGFMQFNAETKAREW